MVNKRMLAVAAVLVLAVPALGAAATIYIPQPVTEQLVEGHTVFTVLQAYNATNTRVAKFAAAVAVLVREQTNQNANARFPGVLWFNDQYLVDPTEGGNAAATYRYPCGGAVMAVNHNEPDPRIALVYANGQPVAPIDAKTGLPQPLPQEVNRTPQGSPGYDAVTNVGYGGNGALVGTDGSNVWTDTGVAETNPNTLPNSVGGGANYTESYYITDPNDHGWIIDKYNGYTRDGAPAITAPSGTAIAQQGHSYFIWVVNVMGGPAFVPDDGVLSCQPYVDGTLNQVYDTAGVTQSQRVYPESAARYANCQTGAPWSNQYTGNPTMVDQPAQDRPCAGWKEPPAAGAGSYCYDGNPYQAGTDCNNTKIYPTRIYNGLLYFKLEDLVVSGSIDHGAGSARLATDTNGCQANTEWQCPNNDDNAEGNSHPFNPYGNSITNPSNDPATGLPCPPGDYQPAGGSFNHGGSAGANYNGNGVYTDLGCNDQHATALIDLYFDGSARPLPPVLRNYAVTDTQGSQAPFAGDGSATASPPSTATFP